MDDTVKILNELIATSEDGLRGFSDAADRATQPRLKEVLFARAQDCDQSLRELQSLVIALGGEPEQSGSLAGAAHRGWTRIKAAVGDSNVAVLDEVERGEDHAKARYARALKADLPPPARQLIEKQYQGVIANHDRIRDLRQQYRAAA